MNRMEIEKAVAEHYGYIRAVVRRTMGKYKGHAQDCDVDDIVQATSLGLVDGRLDNFRYTTDAKLRTWIGFVAVQRTVDHLRRGQLGTRAKFYAVPVDHTDVCEEESPATVLPCDAPQAFEVVAARERLARLQTAAEGLDDTDRELLSLVAGDRLDVTAYAEEHGIAPATVYVRKRRMIRNLGKKLSPVA